MHEKEHGYGYGFAKTKVGITIATIIFLALIIFGELSPLGDFFPHNQLTRKGVQKYRIHILRLPELNKVASDSTTINCTVALDQLGNSRIFRADGSDKFYSYFELTNDWDFKELDEEARKNFSTNSEAKPFYSVEKIEERIVLKKNDQEVFDLKLEPSYSKYKITVFPFNEEKSLILKLEKDKKLAVAYLKDATKPEISFCGFEDQLSGVYFDRNNSRIYAKIKGGDGTGINTSALGYYLAFVDINDPDKSVQKLNCALQKSSKVIFNASANSLGILDKEKFRILRADDGNVTEIKYLNDLLEKPPKDTPPLVNLDRVPAAIVDNCLIDLRDGTLVDKLPGFAKGSLYVIDYENKYLYYSSASATGVPSMEIASYDLHNLALKLQIRLGTRNSEESSREDRLDSLAELFITSGGTLVGLSKPQS